MGVYPAGNKIPAVDTPLGTYWYDDDDTEHHVTNPIKDDTQQLAQKKLFFTVAQIIITIKKRYTFILRN